MKSITISETEYLGLLETINRLSTELLKLKSKPDAKKQSKNASIIDELHCIIEMPKDFDYKEYLTDALIAKHLKNFNSQ